MLSLSEALSNILARYLKVLYPISVTLCVKYSGYYTDAKITQYLIRSHSIKAKRVREILDFIAISVTSFYPPLFFFKKKKVDFAIVRGSPNRH